MSTYLFISIHTRVHVFMGMYVYMRMCDIYTVINKTAYLGVSKSDKRILDKQVIRDNVGL